MMQDVEGNCCRRVEQQRFIALLDNATQPYRWATARIADRFTYEVSYADRNQISNRATATIKLLDNTILPEKY
jgi:hypothetical protein